MERQPDWEKIMSLFNYNREYVQLGSSQFIVSHPEPVRQTIENLRKELDENPVLYTEEKENSMMQRVREIAAEYFAVPNPDDIAMTDSTTMGLGTIYTGLNLQKGQEVLTTNHDHYSQHEAIRQATGRSGGSFRRINLYQNLSEVTTGEIVDSVVRNISEQTRVLGITWVHSSSGLKLPVPEISKALAKINANRGAENKVLMVLDGVHGFGIELETFKDLGCDFFIAGCHKWIYGPRGNGLVAATRDAWQNVTPIIPSFTDTMNAVIAEEDRPAEIDGKQMTPGGFHALEHRWALYDAFKMHFDIGKQNIWNRVHQLNRLCKEGLDAMPHVKLHTPLADEFSAGIISFEVEGYSTEEAVEALLKKKIVATATPYKTSWVRFTPGIINNEEEISKGLEAVHSLRK
jgi:isopenicillin-N epimerase